MSVYCVYNLQAQKSGRVTVPHPKKDIPKGTIISIFKQAGWRN